jgi:hypothetical protein
MPRPIYLRGKSPWYPLDRRLGGSQSRSGRGVEEKNSQPSQGFEPRSSGRPARSQSLYRLSYLGTYVIRQYQFVRLGSIISNVINTEAGGVRCTVRFTQSHQLSHNCRCAFLSGYSRYRRQGVVLKTNSLVLKKAE